MTWWRRGRGHRSSAPRELVLWSRAGCHLCAQMQQVVESVLRERSLPPVQLLVRDLDGAGSAEPGLLARYSDLVPVLVLDGVELAHFQVDPQALRTALLRPVDDAL